MNENIVPFPRTFKVPEKSPETNGVKVTSIRSFITSLENSGDPRVSFLEIESVGQNLGPLSPKDIINAIANSSEEDWARQPAFFSYLLKEFYAPSMREVTDE